MSTAAGRPMDEAGVRHVGIGEIKVGKRGEMLCALLGSCVAIAFIWPRERRCGLAHCLLPTAPGLVLRAGGRYVDQAVPTLLKLMGVTEQDKDELQVILTGGASMFGPARVVSRVGAANVAAAHKVLSEHRLQLHYDDTGGRRGRQVRIDCADHSFAIRKIDHPTYGEHHEID